MAEAPHTEWATTETLDLFETIVSLRTADEAAQFFRDLCTLSELEAMAHRWQAAQLVDQGMPYHEVSKKTGASTTTVPAESPAQTLQDLDGLRAATVYPRLAHTLLAERGVAIDLIEVTGSVEVAPRLGLADAIVDLVSSGSTLRTNGLRSLGVLFSSEAVLIGPPEPCDEAVQLARVFRSVVDARRTRYLMLHAPEGALEAIFALLP